VIIEGGGLVASAFRRWGDPSIDALVFARGVADSSSQDEALYERETLALRSALDRARDTRQLLVYFTGAPIYGSFDEPVVESMAVRPTSRYGLHQAAAEAIIRASGANYLSLRMPNLVGPGGHPHQLIPALVRQVLQGTVTVQAGAARDLVDVADAVQLTQALLASGVRDATINVASGMCTPIDDVVAQISQILGTSPSITRVDGGVAQRFDIGMLRDLVGSLPFDASYPSRTLDRWVPTVADSMRQTIP
jgi:NDP-hexose 4-ketoreductase